MRGFPCDFTRDFIGDSASRRSEDGGLSERELSYECADSLSLSDVSLFGKIASDNGAVRQRWLSVSVAAYPPRPELARLVGGYRRIPVLQIGAHFYCDTRLAFAALTGDESSCWSLSETDEALRRRAEQEVFFAVVAGASPYRAVRFLSGELGVSGLIRFVRDRIAMTRGATIVQPDAKTARRTVLSFINQLADRLAEGAFLSGPQVGYLDLCCFHPLWMATQIDSRKILQRGPLFGAVMVCQG